MWSANIFFKIMLGHVLIKVMNRYSIVLLYSLDKLYPITFVLYLSVKFINTMCITFICICVCLHSKIYWKPVKNILKTCSLGSYGTTTQKRKKYIYIRLFISKYNAFVIDKSTQRKIE